MKVTMLGTGNAMVTECYNTCFAITDGETCFLTDCGGGNGILKQLKEAKIPLSNIHDIFITHEHPDHLLGIVWLVRMIGTMISQGTYSGELRIYCHRELAGSIETMVQITLQKKICRLFGSKIHMIGLEAGDEKTILNCPVTFFDIHSTKAKQFGYTMMMPGDVKFTCLGDEPYHEATCKYVTGSDWLMHEGFCLFSEADIFKPYEKSHSTVKDACETAQKLQIPNLILYHTEEKNLKNRKRLYMQEGRKYYYGNLFVPDDLEILHI